jgi:hypothetical protein
VKASPVLPFGLALFLALPFGVSAQTAPARGGVLVRIEQAIGRPLSPSERDAIRSKALETRQLLLEQQEIFIRGVGGLFGLPEETVRGYLPKVGEANEGFDKNMIPKVEKEIGRPISAQEREKLRGLDEAKKSAVAPIQESFAELISMQSGLSRREAKALLPKVGL